MAVLLDGSCSGCTNLTDTGDIVTNGEHDFGIRSLSTTGSIHIANSGNTPAGAPVFSRYMSLRHPCSCR
jgi:hypothetical protein